MKTCVVLVLAYSATLALFPSAKAGHPTITALGDLPMGRFGSQATGVSDDGRTVVGHSIVGPNLLDIEAFVWRQETGMRGLGYLSGGEYFSQALGVDVTSPN